MRAALSDKAELGVLGGHEETGNVIGRSDRILEGARKSRSATRATSRVAASLTRATEGARGDRILVG